MKTLIKLIYSTCTDLTRISEYLPRSSTNESLQKYKYVKFVKNEAFRNRKGNQKFFYLH